MTLRSCTRCRAVKPADLFGVDKRRTDGCRPTCKACDAEVSRERRATAKRAAAPVVELRPGLRLVDPLQDPAPVEPTAPLASEAQDNGGGRHTTALEAALAAATWLTPVDAAVVEYARGLARGLDVGEMTAMSEFGVVGSVESPQYLMALKALRLDAATRIKDAAPTGPALLNVSGY